MHIVYVHTYRHLFAVKKKKSQKTVHTLSPNQDILLMTCTDVNMFITCCQKPYTFAGGNKDIVWLGLDNTR